MYFCKFKKNPNTLQGQFNQIYAHMYMYMYIRRSLSLRSNTHKLGTPHYRIFFIYIKLCDTIIKW